MRAHHTVLMIASAMPRNCRRL